MLRVAHNRRLSRRTLAAASVVFFFLSWFRSSLAQEELLLQSPIAAETSDIQVTEAWVTDDDQNACDRCRDSQCQCRDHQGIFPNSHPPGLIQRVLARDHEAGSCWSFSTDAVIFWRNAPPSRELASLFSGAGVFPVLNADQLESTSAAGPRFRIIHTDSCGNAAEFIYLKAFNFRSQRTLADPGTLGSGYEPANLFGNTREVFHNANINLGSRFQTFEANGRKLIGASPFTFIAGFRWLEFQESFTMDSQLQSLRYDYRSSVTNSLYGGQLGVDALLLTMPWLTINSWLKGGAFYNNAVQHTAYQSNVPSPASFENAVSGIPAAGSFVGEVGINGTLSITKSIGIRFGYTVLWLQTIALATQQLSNQNALSMNGGTALQGLNLGLEGQW